MVRSMTGFGTGDSQATGIKVTAEVRSVNHRFLDVHLHLPDGYSRFESDLKRLIKERIGRGRVSMSLTIATEEGDAGYELNRPLLKQYLHSLRAFAREEGLEDDSVNLDTLAALPDAFVRSAHEPDDSWGPAREAVERALDGCVAMKEREGQELRDELTGRLTRLEGLAEEAERLLPAALEENKSAFRKRVGLVLENAELNENRVAMELAVLAERVDFTEEVVRLGSHLRQFRETLEAGGVVSKRLTFLLQEIHRECNTICNKASSLDVINRVLEIKGETEKLREQVQNLE
jgi:uncharacterized protein (TIGR00255 family)